MTKQTTTTKVSKTVEKPVAQHRRYEGVVLTKTDKTIRVQVQTMKMHPKYRKPYAQTTKFAVHDEKNLAKEGDRVMFQECRPISKTKKWNLVSVMSGSTRKVTKK